MAKQDLSKVLNDELLEELGKRLGGTQEISFPEPSAIADLDKDALDELADKIGMEGFKEMEESDLKKLLKTVALIGTDDTDEITEKMGKALAVALGVKTGKTPAKTLEALQDYLNADDGKKEESSNEEEEEEEEAAEDEADEEKASDEEESTDDEEEAPKKKKKKSDDDEEEASDTADEEVTDDDEEEKPAKKKKKSSDDEEEEASDESTEESSDESTEAVDPEAVVEAKSKFPGEDDMKERLEAYNEAADEDNQIEVVKGKLKTAYKALLAKMVTSDGNIAKWGVPYINHTGEDGCCCGLPLKDTKFKGDKATYGKCVVTEKVYSLDKDGDFNER